MGKWKNPIVKRGVVRIAGSEVTPFVFKGKLYRLENFKKSEEFPYESTQFRFHEDGFRIYDVEKDRIISIPLLNHYFASAFVWEDRVYVYCGDYEEELPWWNIRKVVMIFSEDLIHWSKPKVVIWAEGEEHLFNTSVTRSGDRFVLLYETDDPAYPKFTFKFCQSTDLVHWEKIPEAIYGKDKYVGGPALYFEEGWFYLLYLAEVGDGYYQTQITRSKDLVHWEDAPADRPFLTPDPTHVTDPIHYPEIYEKNASDVELCYWDGKTIIYYNGGDQQKVGDLKLAEFSGTPAQLFKLFFE